MHSSLLLLTVANLLIVSRPIIAGSLINPRIPIPGNVNPDQATCPGQMIPLCCYPAAKMPDKGVPNCYPAGLVSECLNVANQDDQFGTVYCCDWFSKDDKVGYGCRIQPISPYQTSPQELPQPNSPSQKLPPPDIIKPINAPEFEIPGTTTPGLELPDIVPGL